MSAVDGAPRWVSGLLSGAQGALLSVLAVTTPALAAYVATSADPSNAHVGWSRSVVVGAVLWLMAHGAAVRTSGVAVTLVPLGVTALAMFSAYASARRSAHRTLSAWFAGIGGYTGVLAVVVLLTWRDGVGSVGLWSLLRLLVGTVLVAGLGLAAGMVRVRRLPALTRRWWEPVPALVRRGLAGGVMVIGVLVGVAALVTCGWVLAGRAATDDVIVGLGVDTFGGLLLAVAQLAVLPNFVLWVMAWVVGPGFSVGAGTVFAPGAVVSGPLPALPLLGALPPVGSEGGLLRLAPLVVVVSGALVGWWIHRTLTTTRARHVLLALVCTAATAGLVAALLCTIAGGAVGPGRLAVVGAPPLTIGAAVAGLTALGVVLTAVPADAHVRRRVAAGLRAGWRRLRGQADVALGEPDPGR